MRVKNRNALGRPDVIGQFLMDARRNLSGQLIAYSRPNPNVDHIASMTPGAQHGAAVRGSRYGSLVRVGENFTNENITPVGRNGGMGGGGSAPLYLSVKFGDTEVENVLVGKLDDLYRQRRINVDLTSS